MLKAILICVLSAGLMYGQIDSKTYHITDTGQKEFYNNTNIISEPEPGDNFFGQDANYQGNQPTYTDNGDGTITDNVTGLMWEKSYIQIDWEDALSAAQNATTGGYTDWRVPTIKEMYSLIMFYGNQGTGNPSSSTPPSDAIPFIDTSYFDFEYPSDNRYIDAQYITNTEYTSTTMNGDESFFGLNLADGRIKGYPKIRPHAKYYARFVRLAESYGENDFVDNYDNTITDNATGLMWTKIDSGNELFAEMLTEYTNTDGTLNWQEAMEFAESSTFAGYDDWRLPNAKELHSILDYTKSPDATNSAAISPVFEVSEIVNEGGEKDYPGYLASTTFNPGHDAIVIYFGRALGYMNFGSGYQFYDVHGAGAQRTDAKTGEPTYGFGPQGDVRRVYNHVRLVRDAETSTDIGQSDENIMDKDFKLYQNYPNPFNPSTIIEYNLKNESPVKLILYSLIGSEVKVLDEGIKSAGNHIVKLNASSLSAGVYFYKLEAGLFTDIKKMVLLK